MNQDTETREQLAATTRGTDRSTGTVLARRAALALVLLVALAGGLVAAPSAEARPRHPAPCYVKWPSSTSKAPADRDITCGSSYTTSNRRVITRTSHTVHIRYNNRDVYCGRHWQRNFGVQCAYGV